MTVITVDDSETLSIPLSWPPAEFEKRGSNLLIRKDRLSNQGNDDEVVARFLPNTIHPCLILTALPSLC